MLNEIQSISEKNNAQFILMHVINKNFWLEKDINYQICYKNKIINYSNQNHIKVYNETFANIKKIFKYSVPRDLEWYNSYDGHLSYKYNKKIFKELSKFIFN